MRVPKAQPSAIQVNRRVAEVGIRFSAHLDNGEDDEETTHGFHDAGSISVSQLSMNEFDSIQTSTARKGASIRQE